MNSLLNRNVPRDSGLSSDAVYYESGDLSLSMFIVRNEDPYFYHLILLILI
jgi:hypothetical protein